MNRRDFLGVIVGSVAVSTAVRTWPFRVYSFPSDVKSVNLGPPMRRFYDTDVRRMKISPDEKTWLEDLRRIAWETRCGAMEPGARRSSDRAWQQFAFHTGSYEIVGGSMQNKVPWPLA